MKKSVLYFYTLICSMCILTTSCSKDDNGKQTEEGGSWEELPNGDIPADNVELNLNGTSTTGTISFKALSAETAQIGLKNVIDGYSDVTVDLAMTQQTDGSYKLNGSKEITTKPVTKADNISAAFLKVTVDGSITKEGVVTANIKAEGPGLYIGTYTGTNLVLKYGDEELNGKTVIFDATDGKNISLLLADVIPGDTTTIISGIQLIDSTFIGETATTAANVKYTGSLSNKVLTLALDIAMKDPNNWIGNYALGNYSAGNLDSFGSDFSIVATSPLYVEWQGIEDGTAPLYAGLLRGVGGILLPQVLKNITLESDGNITAQYSSKSITMDQEKIMGMLNGIVPSEEDIKTLIPTSWSYSPKNLAYWYEKDEQLYIKLNIAAIIGTAMGGDASGLSSIISEVLHGSPASIKAMIKNIFNINFDKVSDKTFETLLDWVNNGIPMNVKTINGHTYIYLDKEALTPLLKSYETGEVDSWGNPEQVMDIVIIWQALSEAEIIPKEAEAAVFLVAVIGGYYNMSTGFNLGLDLISTK